MSAKSNRKEYKTCNDEFKLFATQLEHYGYTPVRRNGSHFIFRNRNGSIAVPRHLNMMIKKRLEKEILDAN